MIVGFYFQWCFWLIGFFVWRDVWIVECNGGDWKILLCGSLLNMGVFFVIGVGY